MRRIFADSLVYHFIEAVKICDIRRNICEHRSIQICELVCNIRKLSECCLERDKIARIGSACRYSSCKTLKIVNGSQRSSYVIGCYRRILKSLNGFESSVDKLRIFERFSEPLFEKTPAHCSLGLAEYSEKRSPDIMVIYRFKKLEISHGRAVELHVAAALPYNKTSEL